MSARPVPAAVMAAYDAMPEDIRAPALGLRDLVFEVAAKAPEAGPIAEELRWGEPAYLTLETGAGTTLRIAAAKSGGYGLFVNCRTRLIPEFRLIAPEMRFDGTRGVLFWPDQPRDDEALSQLIHAALTYHRRKARTNRSQPLAIRRRSLPMITRATGAAAIGTGSATFRNCR